MERFCEVIAEGNASFADLRGKTVIVSKIVLRPEMAKAIKHKQNADATASRVLGDTKVGQAKKDDAADVAKTGWKAMLDGEYAVVHGLKNKAQVLASNLLRLRAGAFGRVAPCH